MGEVTEKRSIFAAKFVASLPMCYSRTGEQAG